MKTYSTKNLSALRISAAPPSEVAPDDLRRSSQPGTLATLVAHPDNPWPFPIDQHNKRAGRFADVAEAVASGACYALTVGPDVLAVDCDDDAGTVAGQHLADELRAEGHPVLEVESGRPGHLHVFAVVVDELDRARVTALAQGLGLAPRATIRPPGAPHRLGLPVRVLGDPDVFAAAVEAARVAPPRPLERLDWRHLLASGQWPRGYEDGVHDPSESAKVFAICRGAARAGYGLEDVREMLADPAGLGGEGFRSRGARAEKWLSTHVWPIAVESAHKYPAPPQDADEARQRLDVIRAAVEGHRWVGMAGVTDRAVLLALIDRAQKSGSLTPFASHRQVAEETPCRRETATKSLHRLCDAGWIQIVRVGRGRTVEGTGEITEVAEGTLWRLLVPADLVPSDGARDLCPRSLYRGGRTSMGRSRAHLDACRWGGLGLNAPRIFEALAAGPGSAVEIANTLGLNAGNLRSRLLPRLERHGLIVRDVDGRWRLAEDLDTAMAAAADALELTGKAADVKRQHKVDRENYLEFREDGRPRRAQRRAEMLARCRKNPGHKPARPAKPLSSLTLADLYPSDYWRDVEVAGSCWDPSEPTPYADPDSGEILDDEVAA